MPITWHLLSKKDAKEFLSKVLKRYPNAVGFLKRGEGWKLIKFEKGVNAYATGGEILFLEINGNLIPTLYALQSYDFKLPKVVVDEGAVPHILNGADVMRPGIKEVQGSFKVDEVVVVVEGKHGKPIAVGSALIPWSAAVDIKRGKVIRVVHYVGDQVWKALSSTSISSAASTRSKG